MGKGEENAGEDACGTVGNTGVWGVVGYYHKDAKGMLEDIGEKILNRIKS